MRAAGDGNHIADGGTAVRTLGVWVMGIEAVAGSDFGGATVNEAAEYSPVDVVGNVAMAND